jgi:hypothetical protein
MSSKIKLCSMNITARFSKNSYLCTYDSYGPVRNVFDACRSITRASGRGLGPGKMKIESFLGPV